MVARTVAAWKVLGGPGKSRCYDSARKQREEEKGVWATVLLG